MSNTVLFILYGIGFLTVVLAPLLMCYRETEFVHMVVWIMGSVVFQAPVIYDLFDGSTLRGLILLSVYFIIFFGFTELVSRIYFKGRRKKLGLGE
jgi:hypothetical protein